MIRRLQRMLARAQGRMMAALGVPEADGTIRILVAPDQSTVVRLEPDGTLTMQAPGGARFRTVAESDARLSPWRLTFTRDAAGRVVGVTAALAPRGAP